MMCLCLRHQKVIGYEKDGELDVMKRYNIIMVYDHDFKRILFCRRKKRPYLGKLNFPGGKWEEGETYFDSAYRELWEETGIGHDAITPMFHLIDYLYYDTDSILELYVCRLRRNVELLPEENGNELIWVSIEGTDFGDNEIFGGDGNILHCYLMAKRNHELIFGK